MFEKNKFIELYGRAIEAGNIFSPYFTKDEIIKKLEQTIKKAKFSTKISEKADGCWNVEDRVVRIRPGREIGTESKNILHELTHALFTRHEKESKTIYCGPKKMKYKDEKFRHCIGGRGTGINEGITSLFTNILVDGMSNTSHVKVNYNFSKSSEVSINSNAGSAYIVQTCVASELMAILGKDFLVEYMKTGELDKTSFFKQLTGKEFSSDNPVSRRLSWMFQEISDALDLYTFERTGPERTLRSTSDRIMFFYKQRAIMLLESGDKKSVEELIRITEQLKEKYPVFEGDTELDKLTDAVRSKCNEVLAEKSNKKEENLTPPPKTTRGKDTCMER